MTRPAHFLDIAKMHGAGNDFVVLAVAPPAAPEVSGLVRALAHRRTGIGADGVLFLERLEGEDAVLRMHFYNCDGTRAGLCLNGSRCVALRALQLGWAQQDVVFRTEHQVIRAHVEPGDDGRRAAVVLGIAPPRRDARGVNLPDSIWKLGGRSFAVDVGDPHLVVEVSRDVLEREDFEALARPLRRWDGFSPEGANVHFVVRDAAAGEWSIRSFERGIEGETLACGSGCVSAFAALAPHGDATAHLITRLGARISVTRADDRWTLRGPAELSFETRWQR